MPLPSRRAYVEDAESSEDDFSTSSSSGSGGSSSPSQYPKRGKTRIPTKLVSKRALIDLGYPFFEEGNTVIVQKALGQENIDELLKISEDYKRIEQDIARAPDNTVQDPIDIINVDVGRAQGGTSAPTPAPMMPHPSPAVVPAANNIVPDRLTPDSLGHSRRSRWGDQVLLSGILTLNGSVQQLGTELGSPEVLGARDAWRDSKSLIEDGTIATELFGIHAAECYVDQAGAHKVTLSCPKRPQRSRDESSLVRIRWL